MTTQEGRLMQERVDSMGEPSASSTRLLAKHVANAKLADYSDHSIGLAKQLVLDSVGNAVAGTCTEPGGFLLEYADRSLGSAPEASAVRGGRRILAKDAAFMNAQLAALLDMDETYRNAAHAGSPIVFAALASAEKAHASGERVLLAVLTAYDATTRIVDAMLPTLEKWSTGVFPFCCADAFGPAIAASIVLGLREEQIANALGISGSTARLPIAAKQSDPPRTAVKNAQGWHAEHGVIAADLASLGLSGINNILDGKNAFWAAAGSDRWMPEAITRGLGEECNIDKMSLKAQPACRLIHAPIEAVMKAVRNGDVSVPEIVRIDITANTRLANSSAFTDQAPQAMCDAVFSVPFTVSLALLGVNPGPDWYAPGVYEDPHVLSTAAKIWLLQDPSGEIDRIYAADPIHADAKARVVTAENEYLAECRCPKGDPGNEFSDADLFERVRTMTRAVMAAEQCQALADSIYALEEIKDMREWGDLLRRSCGGR